MSLEYNTDHDVRVNQFSRLGGWYILALSMIATVAIVGQILIQKHLKTQSADSHVINVAGRQRMLSQKITKCIVLLRPIQPDESRKKILDELQPALTLWTRCHEGLQHGNDSLQLPGNNSERIKQLFAELNESYYALKSNAHLVISELDKNLATEYPNLEASINIILQNEAAFVTGMDYIVYQYDVEANAKVKALSKMEYILLGISLLVIALEILFIFRPTTWQVNKTINELMVSEKNAKKLSKEIGELYSSLEKTYEELSYVNEPPEIPKLYAKTDRGGNVTYVSDHFTELIDINNLSENLSLQQLFASPQLDSDWIDSVIEKVSDGGTWTGTIQYRGKNDLERSAELSIVPTFNELGEVEEWAVVGSDITKQKRAERNMREKNRSEVEKKINQQKFRSVLILEGQEEERKRLAMDIHDGIGQMLTSLKYQIESIDKKTAPPAVSKKLDEIQSLSKDIIKEVRRVTFNLKPTVLGDFGLQAALNVFVTEIGKLTDIELTYRSSLNQELRLPQKVENNIFRIIQEAINNAIKHSKASRIEIILFLQNDLLTIKVTDNGEGFDEKLFETRGANMDSGNGFFNMHERTEYINGKLEIKSIPGSETSITLSVPVKNPFVV